MAPKRKKNTFRSFYYQRCQCRTLGSNAYSLHQCSSSLFCFLWHMSVFLICINLWFQFLTRNLDSMNWKQNFFRNRKIVGGETEGEDKPRLSQAMCLCCYIIVIHRELHSILRPSWSLILPWYTKTTFTPSITMGGTVCRPTVQDSLWARKGAPGPLLYHHLQYSMCSHLRPPTLYSRTFCWLNSRFCKVICQTLVEIMLIVSVCSVPHIHVHKFVLFHLHLFSIC